MIWNDATKLRPIKNGGVYVLACPAAADGVEIKLGTYQDLWVSGGRVTPVIYFSEVDNLPADSAVKANEIREALELDWQTPQMTEEDLPELEEE